MYTVDSRLMPDGISGTLCNVHTVLLRFVWIMLPNWFY